MEKHGAIEPGVTPSEHEELAAKHATAADTQGKLFASTPTKTAEIAELDGDLRKRLATVAQKKL
jgi:hypothetical protein